MVRRVGMHGGAHGTSRPGVADSIRQCVPPHADLPSAARGTSDGRTLRPRGSPGRICPVVRGDVRPARRVLPLFPGERPLGREAMPGLVRRGMAGRIPAGMAARWDPDAEGYAGTVLLICVAPEPSRRKGGRVRDKAPAAGQCSAFGGPASSPGGVRRPWMYQAHSRALSKYVTAARLRRRRGAGPGSPGRRSGGSGLIR
jgi:hypothetical protein